GWAFVRVKGRLPACRGSCALLGLLPFEPSPSIGVTKSPKHTHPAPDRAEHANAFVRRAGGLADDPAAQGLAHRFGARADLELLGHAAHVGAHGGDAHAHARGSPPRARA